ncbi:hypothetical protein [Paraglaciecola mesophila]|nr:hypothetical protein [Paraglaciecola mesophila]
MPVQSTSALARKYRFSVPIISQGFIHTKSPIGLLQRPSGQRELF